VHPELVAQRSQQEHRREAGAEHHRDPAGGATFGRRGGLEAERTQQQGHGVTTHEVLGR